MEKYEYNGETYYFNDGRWMTSKFVSAPLVFYALLSTEFTLVISGFRLENLELLYNAARKKSPILWYDSASLASNDEQRFKDGVILADEPVQFIINAFDELVEEES